MTDDDMRDPFDLEHELGAAAVAGRVDDAQQCHIVDTVEDDLTKQIEDATEHLGCFIDVLDRNPLRRHDAYPDIWPITEQIRKSINLLWTLLDNLEDVWGAER